MASTNKSLSDLLKKYDVKPNSSPVPRAVTPAASGAFKATATAPVKTSPVSKNDTEMNKLMNKYQVPKVEPQTAPVKAPAKAPGFTPEMQQKIDTFNSTHAKHYISAITPQEWVKGAELIQPEREEARKLNPLYRGSIANSKTASYGDIISAQLKNYGNAFSEDAMKKYETNSMDEQTKRIFANVAAASKENPLTKAEASHGETMEFLQYKYMTDAEKQRYNELYGIYGKDTAEEFHRLIIDQINERIAQAKYDREVKNLPTPVKVFGQLAGGFESGLRGIAEVPETFLGITNRKERPVSEFVADKVRTDENNSGAANIAYDIARSTGNMIPGIAASAALAAVGAEPAAAQVAGNTMFALSQIGNTYRQDIDEGRNTSGAQLRALQQGVDETVTNALLGGVKFFGDSLLKKYLADSRIGKAVVTGFDKLAKTELGKERLNIIGSALMDAGSEAAQEYLQYFTEGISKNLIYGENQEYRLDDPEAWYSAALGALNAGVLNLPNTAGRYIDAKNLNTTAARQVDAMRNGDDNFVAYGTTDRNRQIEFKKAELLAEKFGTALEVGNIGNVEGEYSEGKIHINEKTNNPVMDVFVHELTHHIEGSSQYEAFSRFVTNYIEETMGADSATLKQAIIQDYAEGGYQLSDQDAQRELVAKFAENKLFKDEAAVNQLYLSDRGLFNTVYNWLRNAAAKVKGTDQEKLILDAQKIYEKALKNNEQTSVQSELYAGQRSKTANFENLENAMDMELKGSDSETIRKETGWFRGADGKWEHESAKGNADTAEDVRRAAENAGYNIQAYHGTSRADRVGNEFRTDRATSGPMAFFTDNKEIAENYAKDKRDTSVSLDPRYQDYYSQFRVTRNGKEMSVPELWDRLSAKEKSSISERAKHITFDDEAANIIYDENKKYGNGGLDEYTINQNKGNVLRALVQTWLEDGNLYGEEERFNEVLRLAGIEDAKYFDPHAKNPKVYETYMKISKPFDASNDVDEKFVESYLKWVDENDAESYDPEKSSGDIWDKNDISAEMFAERMRGDIESGRSSAWTSIPDSMTEYLKSLGYNGIKDIGGKGGGQNHTVWIPFESSQVKSSETTTFDDKGNPIPLSERFNEESNDIRYSYGKKFDELAPNKNGLPAPGKNRTEQNLNSEELISPLRQMKRKSILDFTGQEIEDTKPWAQRFYSEMGPKSPFFRSWFGEWRADDTKSVEIIAADNLQSEKTGKTTNKDTGKQISWGDQLRRETATQQRRSDTPIIANKGIRDIIENAVLLNSEVSEKTSNKKMPNTAFMHNFYSIVEYDGSYHLMKLYVEEALNNKETEIFNRAFVLKDIKKIASFAKGVLSNNEGLTYAKEANNLNVAELAELVKQYDPEYNPRMSSRVVNADGSPKIVYQEGEYTFSDSPKNNGSRAYLKIDNPLMINSKEDAERYENYFEEVNKTQRDEELRRKGYDGVIDNYNGRYVVLDSKQVKSATNSGEFNRESNNRQRSYGKNLDELISQSKGLPAPGKTNAVQAADETKKMDLPAPGKVEAAEPTEEQTGVKQLPGPGSLRDNLPAKAKNYLTKAESRMIYDTTKALSANRYADKQYIREIVRGISEEYLRDGKVSQDTMDRFFEDAWEQGRVTDEYWANENKGIGDYLNGIRINAGDNLLHNYADWKTWKRNAKEYVKFAEDGMAPDVAYKELNELNPSLFPNNIINEADQLERIVSVAKALKNTERKLESYYGDDPAYKEWAKRDFETAVTQSMAEIERVKRYSDEALAKKAKELDITPEKVQEAYGKLREKRKASEKAVANNLLTSKDEEMVGRLLRGEATLESVDPKKYNYKGIKEVYEAKSEYNQLTKIVQKFNTQRKENLRKEADDLLATSMAWRDKRAGILYQRETMERNVRDIVPDKQVAKEINDYLFKPVHDSEADSTRFKNDRRDRIRELDLSRKIEKGNTSSESAAVQFIGEAEDNLNVILDSNGEIEVRDGRTAEEWQTAINEFWHDNPNLDRQKIENAVKVFREQYDEMRDMANEVLIRNGYEPIPYRKGYFPHFEDEAPDSIFQGFKKAFGIETEVTSLPTTINGQTAMFRPGKTYFGNALERQGFNTTYDSVKGFDKYVNGIADIIYQTDNIQRLRQFAQQARYRTSDKGIQEQIDQIRANKELSEPEKDSRISELYADGRFTLSNFVVELDEYTNLLANKKSKADRNIEAKFGRDAFNVLKKFESNVAANMVALNPGSWLTNFVPLTQAATTIDSKSLLAGMWDTLRSYKNGDDFVQRSNFLTNRRGSENLIPSWDTDPNAKGIKAAGRKYSQFIGWASGGMDIVDNFTSDSIVRARYLYNMKNGMSEADAIAEADAWAAGIMADRSKGSMPTLFSERNPLTKTFTQFQLEVNNQLSWLAKDVPEELKKKGMQALAAGLFKFLVGSYLFNQVYEFFVGRKCALDPISIINDTVGDATGYKIPNLVDLAVGEASFKTKQKKPYEVLENLGKNVAEELPFVGGVLGGGRVPISSALPDVGNVIKTVGSDSDPLKKRAVVTKELSKPFFYGALPGGGSQIKKATEGVKAVAEGGSYTVDKNGEKNIQYPVFRDTAADVAGASAKAVLFGKSSLKPARDWVQSGFDTLNAKNTKAYNILQESGVSDREAWKFVNDLRKVSDDNKEDKISSADLKRKFIQESNIPAEAKAEIYDLMLAGEKETNLMSEAPEKDKAELAKVFMEMKDWADSEDEGKTAEKRNALAGSKISGETKAKVYYDMFAGDAEKKFIEDHSGIEESGELINTMIRMKNAKKTETTSESEEKRKAIAESDLSGETKLDLYRELVAGDSDKELVDDLKKEGVDGDEAMNFIIDMKKAEALSGDEKTNAKIRALERSGFQGNAKYDVYKDKYASESEAKLMNRMSGKDRNKITDTLIKFKKAENLSKEESKDEKIRVIIDSGLSETAMIELYLAKMVSGDDAKETARNNIAKAKSAGISFTDYLKFKSKVDQASGTNKKTMIVSWIAASGGSPYQKDIMYLLAGYKESTLDDTPWHGGKLKAPKLPSPGKVKAPQRKTGVLPLPKK